MQRFRVYRRLIIIIIITVVKAIYKSAVKTYDQLLTHTDLQFNKITTEIDLNMVKRIYKISVSRLEFVSTKSMKCVVSVIAWVGHVA